MRFAENLKKLMRARGVTQTQVAAAAGVGQPQVSRWLQGPQTPYPRSLSRLAKFFNITPDDLLTGRDLARYLRAAVALADKHPGTLAERQALFERTVADLQDDAARWKSRAERAERELARLRPELARLSSGKAGGNAAS